ncbi:MAG: cyclase family protein [Acidobacteriota bacterium]
MRQATRAMLTVCFTLTAVAAGAQSWQPPADTARCPSKWGAGDERGSVNLMSRDTVLRAARLITTGEVFELGQVLEASMPFFGPRIFNLQTKLTNRLPGANHRASNEEMVVTELGQVGTQIDGFAHQTIGDSLYNCFSLQDTMTRNGFTKLGIEKMGTLMTRGVLIDVAALKGVPMLGEHDEITAQDLQDALKRENLVLQPGDAVLVYTGWGALWNKDNVRYMATEPGIGVGAAEWLVKQNPMVVGSDNWGVEVVHNPDPTLNEPVHQIMLTVNGVTLIESLKLDVLAARGVHEFAFVVEPLKMKGATGSTIAPIAVR